VKQSRSPHARRRPSSTGRARCLISIRPCPVASRDPPSPLRTPPLPPAGPQTQDLAKKLKESGGLDLMGYIEFQR
jgi:hypothetical protein